MQDDNPSFAASGIDWEMINWLYEEWNSEHYHVLLDSLDLWTNYMHRSQNGAIAGLQYDCNWMAYFSLILSKRIQMYTYIYVGIITQLSCTIQRDYLSKT